MMASKKNSSGGDGKAGRKIVSENRRARHRFHILETIEAGISLVGTEVKSLRAGQCTIGDAYINVGEGQAWLTGMHIPQYAHGNIHNHDPDRTRRLLMHKREIADLEKHVTQLGHTAVPLSIYFTRGKAKVLVGIAKGKDAIDRRESIKERDTKRQVERELRMKMR